MTIALAAIIDFIVSSIDSWGADQTATMTMKRELEWTVPVRHEAQQTASAKEVRRLFSSLERDALRRPSSQTWIFQPMGGSRRTDLRDDHLCATRRCP